MSTYNVSASNMPMTNQVLTSDYNGSGQWSNDLIVNTITTSSLNTLIANTSIISGTSSITGSGSITINSGVSTYNSMGHYYGCSCLSCSSQISGMGAYTTPLPPPQYTQPGNITVEVAPQDEMKSKPTGAEGAHDHIIECRLKVENVKVIAEYFCFHCNEVLHSKVISKLPASIMNKKCLPRLVKGV
jgi:hypothetical protein